MVLTSGGQITLYWSPPTTGASLYEVHVFPTQSPAPSNDPNADHSEDCALTNAHCTNDSDYTKLSAKTSFSFNVDSGVTSYMWRVRAINSLCDPPATNIKTGPWTSISTFTIGAGIAGNFYLDDAHQSTVNPSGLCSLAGATRIDPGSSSSIFAKWGSNGQISNGTIQSGSYSITGVGSYPNTIVTFNNDPNTKYTCVCPGSGKSCSYSGLTAPTTNPVDFFLTTISNSWFQTRNGLLFAGNPTGSAAISSQIPPTCQTKFGCIPALSLKDTFKNDKSEGYAVSVSNDPSAIDSTQDTNTLFSNLREDSYATSNVGHISGVTLKSSREDFAYFSKLFSTTGASQDEFSYQGGYDGGKPTSPPLDGRSYNIHCYDPLNNGGGSTSVNPDCVINLPWHVNSNESLVLFIDGNLIIKQPIIVDEGGFLSFIVKGNITFDSNVGQSNPLNSISVADGVYIANGQIIIAHNPNGNDLKFVGAGSFVGWGGFQLNRSLSPATANNTAPAELFLYRPDFVINTPLRMTKPYQLWQEVN